MASSPKRTVAGLRAFVARTQRDGGASWEDFRGWQAFAAERIGAALERRSGRRWRIRLGVGSCKEYIHIEHKRAPGERLYSPAAVAGQAQLRELLGLEASSNGGDREIDVPSMALWAEGIARAEGRAPYRGPEMGWTPAAVASFRKVARAMWRAMDVRALDRGGK